MTETVAERVQSLQAEAKNLAADHVKALTAAMWDLRSLAADISVGGDAYPAGVRDVARRVAEELDVRAQTIEGIMGRSA